MKQKFFFVDNYTEHYYAVDLVALSRHLNGPGFYNVQRIECAVFVDPEDVAAMKRL